MSFLNVSAADQSEYMNDLVGIGYGTCGFAPLQ